MSDSAERVSFIPSTEERNKMKALKNHFGLQQTTELVRFCITRMYNEINDN